MFLRLTILLIIIGFVTSLYANPNADFSLSTRQGCVPLTVNYKDLSSGSPVKYEWDFGNGNKSILKNPSAIYYKSGNFTVTLTVWDAANNKSVRTFSSIRVFKNPTARFSADTVGCAGDILNFNDLSLPGDTAIVKWTWDYGDGNLSNFQNSKHDYTYDSKFTVGLTVIDGHGCQSIEAKVKYIRIKPSPKLDFTLNSNFSCAVPVKFNTLNNSSGATSYYWTCTNGVNASGKDFFFTIANFGSYDVILSATTNGCSASISKPVNVKKLKADFTPPFGTACQGTPLAFNNTCSPNIKGARYLWEWGDGKSDTSRNSTHAYNSDGPFTVKLTITIGACSEVVTKTIFVPKKPKIIVSYDTIVCDVPGNLNLKVSGSPLSLMMWDWGAADQYDNYHERDTYPGNIKSFTHLYSRKWSYLVSYKATDAANGCLITDTLDNLVHAGNQSVKIVPYTELYGCIPKTFEFRLVKKIFEEVKGYQWFFSDDTALKYNTQTVSRTFTKVGKYFLKVKVLTASGCILWDTVMIKVGTHHAPDFYIKKPKDYCGIDFIHWVNTTKPDSLKKKYYFNLVPINPLSPINHMDTVITITYDSLLRTSKGGLYLIKLQLNDNGCSTLSDFTDTIRVHGPYPALGIEKLDCKYELIRISASSSWSNRTRLTIDDSVYNYTQPFKYKIRKDRMNIIKYTAWNDTFGCKATDIPSFPAVSAENVKSSLSGRCAPATATVFHDGDVLKKAKWIFPNGDSSFNVKAKYKFSSPGKFIIKLVGYMDSIDCKDTTLLNFEVQGAEVRGNIINSGQCLPIAFDLQDSSAGTDSNIHTWKIGDDYFDATGFSTKYVINSVPKTGNSIAVSLLVASGGGCKSEKNFDVPFSGPKISYTVKRFTICDTPIFYFDAFIKDSFNTKFPVAYQWKFYSNRNNSPGLMPIGPNYKGKFRDIGMNYFDLYASDKNGCAVIIKDSFEVSPNMLQPLFSADPTGRFCPPLQCKFKDLSKSFSADIVKWEWDFGDGTTSQLRYPEKLYLLPGKYDLKLKVTSSNGCVATLIKPGYVIVNGPRGSYDFDRGDACLPHKVQFRGKTLDSATMEWDLGDGVVQQGNYFNHIYNKRGRYIPAMILSDTLGCKYTLPPIDTIEIFDYPKASIIVNGLCFHEPIDVKTISYSNHDNPTLKSNWFLNGKLASPGKDSVFMPESRGFQEVSLIVENKGGCKDTAVVKIKVFAPKAQFSPSKPLVCLGEPLTFINQSFSDTFIKSFDWDFDDKNTSQLKDPVHTYSKAGEYDVQLIATDILDCLDTIKKPASAVVGDTIPPPSIPIRRASVVNNRVVELMYAKFPTFDFTKYIVYREANGRYNKMAEVTDRSDTVFYDKQCNTLDASYCYRISTQNLCRLYSPLTASSEHCTIETKAFGKLDANHVRWSPYIGFDSIEYYEVWRQDYNDPKGYIYLGKVVGSKLNYIDTLITCNTRQNYRIVAKQFMGFKEYSNSDTASAKPYSINTTKPNLSWRATVENDEFARVEWLNNAWSKNGMKAYLLTKQMPDGHVVFNNRYFNLMDTFYNDQQTNVHEKSYVYSVQGIDLCDDTTPVSNVSQTILLKCHFDEASQKPALKWNLYNHWNQEVSHYEIEQKMPDGTFIQIGKVNAMDSQFIHMDAKQNCTPFFRYRVRAVSFSDTILKRATFSLSNEADAAPHSTLFIPDAFSPDKNNLNEVFGPQGQYISKYKFQIYNRWGELIFETNNCMEAWNGYYKDERCEQDVYLYHLEATGADKKSYNLKGTFHLFR